MPLDLPGLTPIQIDPASALAGAALALVLALLAGWLIVRNDRSRLEAEHSADIAEWEAGLVAERQRAEEARRTLQAREERLEALNTEATELKTAVARLETTLDQERQTHREKLAVIERAKSELSDAFKALSAEALNANNQAFLDLARQTMERFQDGARSDLDKRHAAIADLVQPVRQSLDKVDGQIQALEQRRQGAYEGLKQQILSLAEGQKALTDETHKLVRALRTPAARGRWGEIQLRRVVELAGMQDHCDFYEQPTVDDRETGNRLRPDLKVALPGGTSIIIDAKTPLEAYLDAIEAEDEATRVQALRRHARQVRTHVQQLGAKAYWAQFETSPEFVVLFLPGESFFSAALEQDPTLIEAGLEHNVILATPTTLIACLRAVAYGWRQERLAESAREISAVGADLHKRLGDLSSHLQRLGRHLGQTVNSYNGLIGSMENRVLVSARKLSDLHAVTAGSELAPLSPLEAAPRPLSAPELTDDAVSRGDEDGSAEVGNTVDARRETGYPRPNRQHSLNSDASEEPTNDGDPSHSDMAR